MNDDLDDLDRALLALPLEAPPAGMREAILRATVFAGSTTRPAFGRWEIVGIGSALALGAWLVIFAIFNHAYAAAVAANTYAFARALGDPTTFAWLATGGVVALAVTAVNFRVPRTPLRLGRP